VRHRSRGRPRSVHSECVGWGIEPRNCLNRGGGDCVCRRTQHGHHRYARCCSPRRGRRAHHAHKDRIGTWEVPHLAVSR
jgi:hypothetical protein